MIENDIEKNGYEHGMKDTQESLFLTEYIDSQETSAAARQQSEWIVAEGRITDYPTFLPSTTQPYREVTAVPVVRSTGNSDKEPVIQNPEWTSSAPEAVDSRLHLQSPKIAFKGKSVEDQPEESEKTDSEDQLTILMDKLERLCIGATHTEKTEEVSSTKGVREPEACGRLR